MKSLSYILIFTAFSFLKLSAQINSYVQVEIEKTIAQQHEAIYNKGRLLIENENYTEANIYLDSLFSFYPSNISISYLSGICNIHNKQTKNLSLLKLKSAAVAQNNLPNYNFWLGMAYEANDSLTKAIDYYELYFSNTNNLNNTKKNEALRRIDNLKMAGKMKNYLNYVSVKNIGKPVNTEADEYVPLVSSDESVLIYTYRGKLSKGGKQSAGNVTFMHTTAKEEEKIYYEDVFIATKISDTLWSNPVPIKSINTNLHDAAVTLSSDGTMLFIYKNLGKGNGDLYLSKLNGNVWSIPVYQRGLNSDKWDGSAAFFPDNKKIIFSSERKGGEGGKDLYLAEMIGDNIWGNIVNMGKVLNTSYDEDAPFITSDGKTLFFASNGKLSTGGYDILRSDLVNGEWSKPYNIGKPINTPNDDKFYIVTGDGKKGYYSTVKENGLGGQDIYCIEPGILGKPIQIVQVSGIVTLNEKPVAANILINSTSNKSFKTQSYQSNTFSGKYLMNLPVGEEFELVFNCKGMPPQKKMINTMEVDSFIPITIISDFYTKDYINKLEKKIDSLDLVTRNANNAIGYDDFNTKYGTIKKDSLFFKIQVGAYKFIENFNYMKTAHLGRLLRKVYDDGITRFTVGNYTTFNEAYKNLSAVRESAAKDAFIIAVYKNKHYYLKDILNKGIISK